MRIVLLVLWALLPFAASATARVTVVGGGDCRDSELALAVRSLSAALERQPAVQLMSEAEVLGVLGRGPTRSPDEIQRQIEGARHQFYQAKYHRALSEIEAAQEELRRLPPGEAGWRLRASARVVEGLIRTRLKSGGGTEEAFRAVLRLEPTYQLDVDYYGPSTLALFEQVRTEVQKAKRARLTVKSAPPGADVFLDGRRVGATPYAGDHLPGPYQLAVGRGETFSLTREVEVGPRATEVQVDLSFEAAVETSRVPCLASDRALRAVQEKTLLGQAVKLGVLLDVEQLVVLRLDRGSIGPGWLSATLVGMRGGEKIREGGLQVGPHGFSDTAMSELARFVATGESTPNVRPSPDATASIAAPAPVPLAPPAHQASVQEASVLDAPSGRWRRPTGQITAGVGGAAVVTGAVLTGLGFRARSELARLEEGGLHPDEAPAARRASDRAALYLPLGAAALGVGALAVGTGAFFWLTAPSPGGAGVTVAPSVDDGPGVRVSGRF
jgi:hypothetical protein